MCLASSVVLVPSLMLLLPLLPFLLLLLPPAAAWESRYYPHLGGLTGDEIRAQYLGVLDDAPALDEKGAGAHLDEKGDEIRSEAFPNSFDWRDTPQARCIGPVVDQGKCGSCWAVSSTESMSDRRCIRLNSDKSPRLALSSLDVIACDHMCEGLIKCCRGCTGGYPRLAFQYFEHKGVVSETCMPYNLTRSLLCPLPKCSKPLNDTAFRAKHARQVLGGPLAMQHEIQTQGPIAATFTVFEDFMTYSHGIYAYTSGKRLGLHAVKVVGWGQTKNGTKYWKAFNSWGESWGMNGTFNIAFGQCGFEESVYTATPCMPGEICV